MGTVFSLPVRFQPDELGRIQLLWYGYLGVDRVWALGLPEKGIAIIDELNN
ncbi:TPA: hypothetical protein ACG3NF_001599 [Legionella pneumophila]|uniref:Uncharacterized protein n=1 Tax=Legionella pneumophila TaxID=446 RepID=A0AAP3MDU3_LEGPN|nr:hypothetical protein [Legionella pneumophila]MCK1858396.1 hypothetical protein [Legionella pneumophila]MCO1452520.1 hypothetical protein [Legionella pneumophila]MCW8456011.1 hypothetical protein [Legionella pneumophila]MCZ4691363.1 hypothetical protein [Legionella pneumophila]MCZ4711045.1 hypothetical protein [Legionella pneumophila]